MAQIVDSYSESNQTDIRSLGSAVDGYSNGEGQCFTGDGGTLYSVKFYLKKTGLPTGTANFVIYEVTGTFGVNAKPTGGGLAWATNYDVENLTESFQLLEFIVPLEDKITLVNGTKYFATILYSNNQGVGNTVDVGIDTSGTHNGNEAFLIDTTWDNIGGSADLCFYVYKDEVTTTSTTSSTSTSSSTTSTSSSSSTTSTSSSTSSSTSTSVTVPYLKFAMQNSEVLQLNAELLK